LAFNDGRSGVIGNDINYKSVPGRDGRGEERREKEIRGEECSDTVRFS